MRDIVKMSKHFFCVLAFFINFNCILAGETYKSIVWDPDNPLFINGNSSCPHRYKRLKIRSTSTVNFICPNVATVLQTTKDEVSKTNKFENLWLLYNKESFDKCDTTLDINVTEPALRCTEPTQLRFHSITFLPFANLLDEQAFRKGHSYYIIATSNGKYSHINDTSGGHCNDTNVSMKIEVYVCNNTEHVEDEMCKEGVGELTCPDDTVSSSSSVSTPSTSHVTMLYTPAEATATQTPTPTPASTPTTVTTMSTASVTTPTTPTTAAEKPDAEATNKEGAQGLQKGDTNGDSKTVWMVTACIFMVLCILMVIAFICYFFCLGKKKACQYETRKVTPSPQYARKNPAFKGDNDGSTEQDTASLPDKDNDIVIYNKEVFYSKGEGEDDKKNLPV